MREVEHPRRPVDHDDAEREQDESADQWDRQEGVEQEGGHQCAPACGCGSVTIGPTRQPPGWPLYCMTKPCMVMLANRDCGVNGSFACSVTPGVNVSASSDAFSAARV